MLGTKVSDLTVDEFRALVSDAVRQTLDEMRRDADEIALQKLEDPKFPLIAYRREGAEARPVIRGTAIHVKAIVSWVKFGETPQHVADDYNLDIKQVQEAQAFYEAHKAEIDADLQEEEDLEEQHKKETKKSRARKNVKAKTSPR
ncbi:MAG: DUF433 domain-containing protein [Chloroflexota bacterium]